MKKCKNCKKDNLFDNDKIDHKFVVLMCLLLVLFFMFYLSSTSFLIGLKTYSMYNTAKAGISSIEKRSYGGARVEYSVETDKGTFKKTLFILKKCGQWKGVSTFSIKYFLDKNSYGETILVPRAKTKGSFYKDYCLEKGGVLND